jgi:hypothetical protein
LLQVADREPRDGDRIVRVVLNGPQGAVVGFETAAMVHRWELLRPPAKPALIVPAGGRGGTSIPIADDEICWRGVVPVSTPARTALDIACRGVTDDAVVAVDSALRSTMVCAAELNQLFAVSRPRGISAARRVLALSDPGSGSVPETQARLLFSAAGLPISVTQLLVLVDGRIVARVDFGWPEAMLIVEIDGFGPHSGRTAFQHDRTRQNALVNAGWLVLRFTVEDIRLRPEMVVREIRRALARVR